MEGRSNNQNARDWIARQATYATSALKTEAQMMGVRDGASLTWLKNSPDRFRPEDMEDLGRVERLAIRLPFRPSLFKTLDVAENTEYHVLPNIDDLETYSANDGYWELPRIETKTMVSYETKVVLDKFRESVEASAVAYKDDTQTRLERQHGCKIDCTAREEPTSDPLNLPCHQSYRTFTAI
ncbi:uncharacterized protein PAC_05097 [Phialocephala subalpina]|uniref:Uncharacterized protein n=1 Tax=Phialocephala subalpina TaxID=576137 RepID=A0A1L7WR14_9HELO|nr:uncharacterized protein PAC_05097 [Phialocephala subalpina]